jgi:hypothetical protein
MVDAIPPANDPVSTASVAAVLTIAPGTAQPTPVRPLPPEQPSDDPFGPAVVIGPSARPQQFVVYDSQGRLRASIPPSDANPPPPPAQLAVGDPAVPPSLIYLR